MRVLGGDIPIANSEHSRARKIVGIEIARESRAFCDSNGGGPIGVRVESRCQLYHDGLHVIRGTNM